MRMRSAIVVASLLVSVGSSLGAVAMCCLRTYGPITSPAPFNPCTQGASVFCETGDLTVENGLFYQGHRSAICISYDLNLGDSYTASCTSPVPQGYHIMSGSLSGGQCCFVKNSVKTKKLNHPSGLMIADCYFQCKKHP